MSLKRTPLVVIATCVVSLTTYSTAQSQRDKPNSPGASPAAAKPSKRAEPASPLQLTVENVALAQMFPAYVGGGDGIRALFTSDGAAFLAGDISSDDEKRRLIKVTFTVTNPTPAGSSFKIGDVAIAIDSKRLDEFAAVGYNYILCAMSAEDRKKVKEIAVQVPPKGTRRLSIVFPSWSPDFKKGTLLLGSSVAAHFDIADTPGKPRGR